MRPWHRVAVAGSLLVASGVVACGGSASSPLSPTAPASISGELRLSSVPSLNIPGDTFRLTLTSISETGSLDLTTTATWQSSAPDVADVRGGDVRAISAGTALITATHLGRSVSAAVTVLALGSVRGVVHETAPTEQRGIAGVTVTVIGGRFDGRRANTDASGAFQLPDLAGAVTIRFDDPRYESFQIDVDASADAPLDVALAPPMGTVTDVFAFDGGHLQTRSIDSFSLPMHRRGQVQITLESWMTPYVDDGGDYIVVELLRDGTAVARLANCDTWALAAGAPCNGTRLRLPQQADVSTEGGVTYQLRVSSERHIISAYRVTVTHPR